MKNYQKFPISESEKTIESIICQYPKTLQAIGELRDWQIKELKKLFLFHLKKQAEFISENADIDYYKKYWGNVSDEVESDEDEHGIYTMEPCVDKESIMSSCEQYLTSLNLT